jgi:hypothetical protein
MNLLCKIKNNKEANVAEEGKVMNTEAKRVMG